MRGTDWGSQCGWRPSVGEVLGELAFRCHGWLLATSFGTLSGVLVETCYWWRCFLSLIRDLFRRRGVS